MIYICVKIENNNLYLMDIMKYNIFDETKEEKIEKDIRTIESLDIIEDIDIDKFKNYTEINKDSIPLKYEEYLINKQDFEEDNKERDIILNDILEDLNKNIEININQQQEDSKQKAIEEILEILKYNQSDKKIKLRDSIKYQLPYTSLITVSLLALLIVWYIVGLPLGIRSFPTA